MHHLYFEQIFPQFQSFDPASFQGYNVAIDLVSTGDIFFSTPGTSTMPTTSTLSIGNVNALGGTVVQGNAIAKENLTLTGLLPLA